MTLQTLGSKLAAVPNRALAAIPDLPSYSPRPARRSWTAGETVAAFALGLAVGVALAVLLQGGPLAPDEEVEPSRDDAPA